MVVIFDVFVLTARSLAGIVPAAEITSGIEITVRIHAMTDNVISRGNGFMTFTGIYSQYADG
jgi:hypothetical protein